MPPGSFHVTSTPCEELLAPGKLNKQQQIPGLGIHGPAFYQSSAQNAPPPLPPCLHGENQHILEDLAQVLYNYSCFKLYLACLRVATIVFIIVFSPSRFHFLVFSLAPFHSLAMPSLKPSSGSSLCLEIPSCPHSCSSQDCLIQVLAQVSSAERQSLLSDQSSLLQHSYHSFIILFARVTVKSVNLSSCLFDSLPRSPTLR